MSKLFIDNGFLSEKGQELVSPFQESINKIFESAEVKNLNSAQLRALGANLSKIIGDTVSDYLVNKRK